MNLFDTLIVLCIIYVIYRLYNNLTLMPTVEEFEKLKKQLGLVTDEVSTTPAVSTEPIITSYEGIIKIRDKCLDLNNNNRENGNKIQLYDCNNGVAQKWKWNNKDMQIKLLDNPNKCMQLNSINSTLHISDCIENNNDQKFLYTLADKHFQQNEKYIDLSGDNTNNGTTFWLNGDYKETHPAQMFTWA